MNAVDRNRQIEIERIIVEFIEDFNFVEYPMSVGNIARTLSIELKPYSSLDDNERELAEAVSEDAFSMATRDYSHAVIAYEDRGDFHVRARFSGAHELGHVLLEHPEKCSDLHECEADYFAGYILAPHPLVLVNWNKDTADLFGVSRQCASFARDQVLLRKREGGYLRPHEKWIIDNARFANGGLTARP